MKGLLASYYKKKAPKSYHFFILKDGVSVASDTYWQEPSYFVPSSVCVLIFYHHTVFKINNELQFSLCWNNPTRRKVFLNHYLPVKCFFVSYVNVLFATDFILHAEHKFASVKRRQARWNSPTWKQYRNCSWLHRGTATKIVCISPTSKIAPSILFAVDKLWFDERLWQPLRNEKVCLIWSWNGNEKWWIKIAVNIKQIANLFN